MATPYLRNYYAGGGTSTTLANAMGEFDGSFVITADTGWPGGAGFFTVVVDRGTSSEEKIRCASNSGTTVTVASDGNGGRGYDGTSPTGHNAGATVSLCGTAVDFDQANQVVTQVLGQSGAAKGDILAMLSAAGPNTLTRVPIGTSTQVLGVSAGLPAWETPANGYGIAGFAANPMTPAVSLTTSESYISGSTVTANASTATNITSLSLAAGTWDITARGTPLSSAAGSHSTGDLWIGPTTASATSAYASTSYDLSEFSNPGGFYQSISLRKIVVLGSPTTVFMTCKPDANANHIWQFQSAIASVGNCSGITAVRVA